MKRKLEPCMLSGYEVCDNCGDCYKYELDISYDEPSEDEIIEKLYYESEREADLI